jgi:hypothetical protein
MRLPAELGLERELVVAGHGIPHRQTADDEKVMPRRNCK